MSRETLDFDDWCLEREIAGLVSSAPPVMMAYHINKECRLQLVRPPEDLHLIKEGQTHYFASFSYPLPDGSCWWLLHNQSYTQHEKKLTANALFAEVFSQVPFFYQRKNLDYLLWYEGDSDPGPAFSACLPLLRKVPYIRSLQVLKGTEQRQFNHILQY